MSWQLELQKEPIVYLRQTYVLSTLTGHFPGLIIQSNLHPRSEGGCVEAIEIGVRFGGLTPLVSMFSLAEVVLSWLLANSIRVNAPKRNRI